MQSSFHIDSSEQIRMNFKTQKFQQKDSVEFDRGKFHKPGQNVASSLALTQVLQYCHIN